MRHRVGVVFDGIIDSLAGLAVVLLVFVIFSVTGDVVFRYFLGRATLWVLPISEIILLFITFLGTAWVLKREKHVAIDLVVIRLKPKTRALLGMITSILGILTCLVFVWYGSVVSWDHFARHVYLVPLLKFPEGPVLAIIPIGSFLLLIQFLRRTYAYLCKWKASPGKEQSHP